MRHSTYFPAFCLAAVLCVGQACSAQSQQNSSTPRAANAKQLAEKPVTADQAVDMVHDTVMKKHLTALKEECVSYVDPVQEGPDWVVDVREKHGAACGGDPQTQPRLFRFAIDRKTGRMKTDAQSPDHSQMLPVK